MAECKAVAAELDAQEQRNISRRARAAILDALTALGGEGRRPEILALALRDGGFSDHELAAPAPDKARAKHPTYVEYRLSWALTNLKQDGLLENPRWSVWRLSRAITQQEPESVRQLSTARLTELRAMPYRTYLRTPEWRQTRAAALERANRRCSLNQTHTDHLEVHHNNYDRLGVELPSDLVVLCRECHRVHHQAYGRPRRAAVSSSSRAPVRAASTPPQLLASSAADPARPVVFAAGKRSLLRRIFAGA